MNWNDLKAIWSSQDLPSEPGADLATLQRNFETKRRKMARGLFRRDVEGFELIEGFEPLAHDCVPRSSASCASASAGSNGSAALNSASACSARLSDAPSSGLAPSATSFISSILALQ